MADVTFPILLLTDKTLFGELSTLFTETAKQLAAQQKPNAILFYQVCDAPEWAHQHVKPPTKPDRMLIMAFQPAGRDAVAQAVDKVGRILPEKPAKAQATFSMKENTPLRNFFKQLEDIPLTRLRVNTAATPNASLFFLRTPEVIEAFHRELPAFLLAAANAASAPATPPPAEKK
jgi:hypothetical protein